MHLSRTSIVLLAGAVAMLGCAQPRVEYTGAFEATLDPDCKWDGTAGSIPVVAGSMNAAVASGYWMVMKLEVVDNNGLGSRDHLLVNEAEFSYACQDTLVSCAGFRTLEPTVVPLSAVVAADQAAVLLMPVFTSEAANAVQDWATDKPGTILVGIKFRGDYGESAAIEFPVAVYRIPPAACPSGSVQKLPTCPAFFGMNGNDSYVCEPANP
ncbi:MAG TPA: hypothetical protein VGK67_18245 [Myxococcales bacterium]|jgi:hypothetical protein